jgi:hypothetical protein
VATAPTAAFPTQLPTGTAAEFGPSQIANLTGQLPNLQQYLPFSQAQQSTDPNIQNALSTLSNYGNPSQLWNNPQALQGLMGRPGTIDALSSLLGYAQPPAPTAPTTPTTTPTSTPTPTSSGSSGAGSKGGFGGGFGGDLASENSQIMGQFANAIGGGAGSGLGLLGTGGGNSSSTSSTPPASGSATPPSFHFGSLFGGGSNPGNATTTPTTPQPAGSGTTGGSPFGGIGNWFQNAPGASQLQSPGGIFGAPLSGASAPSSNLFGGGF